MILPKIRVLHSHGRQAIPDLDAVELTPEFRGRPCLTETRDADDAERAAAVCPTGALEVPAERRGAGMGVAVINEDTCLSFQGMRCEVCYRACPLIDEAITIDYRPREGDDIHAVFAPQVVPDGCPGCGLCEQRCPVSDPAPAIVVVPTGAQEETYVARRNGAA